MSLASSRAAPALAAPSQASLTALSSLARSGLPFATTLTAVTPQPMSPPMSAGMTLSPTGIVRPTGPTLPAWTSGITRILAPEHASVSQSICTWAIACWSGAPSPSAAWMTAVAYFPVISILAMFRPPTASPGRSRRTRRSPICPPW